MRPRRVLPVLLLLTLSACGGGDGGEDGGSADEPTAPTSSESPADPLVGTYDTTSVVDRTDLPGKGNTKGTEDELALVISCLDEECGTLAARGTTTSGTLSRTVRLTGEDGNASGERVRTGPCTQTPNSKRPGNYTETASYRYTADGDELSGEVDYAFKGCGFDGTSHLTVTGTRVEAAPTYLPAEEVESLTGPLTAYDDATRALYAGFDGCYKKSYPATAGCMVGLLDPWAGTFPGLTAALDGVDGPTPTCQKALGATRLAPLERRVTSTVQGLKASGAAQRKAVDKAVPDLVTLLTSTHQSLVTALALCIDPVDTGSLGKDGALAVDVDARLPVPDES